MSADETRWWWVRHAPVPDGGRIYGQSDLDCDCTDVPVFAALARELPRGAAWVTSHLGRTRQTAAAILAAMEGERASDQPLAVPELAEQYLGDWQGRDRKEFFAQLGERRHAFWFGPAHEPAPNGESFADVVTRVGVAIERLWQNSPAATSSRSPMAAPSRGARAGATPGRRSRPGVRGGELLDHADRSPLCRRGAALAGRGGKSSPLVPRLSVFDANGPESNGIAAASNFE